MPSRNRNKPTIEEQLIQLSRLYFYRFGIFIQDHEDLSISSWIIKDLNAKYSAESITDEIKEKRNFTDVNPWPVPTEVWTDFIYNHFNFEELTRSRLI